jgi:hypothetical protein
VRHARAGALREPCAAALAAIRTDPRFTRLTVSTGVVAGAAVPRVRRDVRARADRRCASTSTPSASYTATERKPASGTVTR